MYHLHGSSTPLLSCYPQGFAGEARAEGSGQGGEGSRSLTCLIPVLKDPWIQGCWLCKRWRGHCAWPFVWAKPPQNSCSRTRRGVLLCQEDPGPLCSVVCAWGPPQLILLLLPRHLLSGTGMHTGLGRGHPRPIISWHSSSWERDIQRGTDGWTGVRGLQRHAAWLCSLPSASLPPQGLERGSWVCWWPDME